MELKLLWQILWRHRQWALSVSVLAVVVVGFVTFTMAPVYQATSKLILEFRSAALTGVATEPHLRPVSERTNPLDTQVELIRSAPVITKVIARADLRHEETGEPLTPYQFLRQARVTNLRGTDIIEIAVEHSNPGEARRIANMWSRIFVDESLASSRIDASQAVKFISQQIEKTKAELAQAESALRDFKEANGAVNLTEEARSSVHTLATLDAEIRQATAAHREAASRVGSLRRDLGFTSSQALAYSTLSQDPTIQRLKQQLLAAETDLTNVTLGANHPEVKQQQAQVHVLREKLAQHGRDLIGRKYDDIGLRASLDPIRQGLARDLLQAEGDVLAYQTRLQTLRALSGSFNQRIATLPEKELRLTQIERDVAVGAELYRMLQRRYEEARIQAAMDVGNVRVLEEAQLPAVPVRPNKMGYMAAGLALALLLGLAVAALREYLDDTLKNAEAAEAALKLPAIGMFPWLPTKEEAQLVIARDPRSPAAEAYRILRTNLSFLAGESPLKTLALTSAGAQEGKSTTAANLAISFALTGKKVLLVDTDMRKPRLHEIFKLPHVKGLSTLLMGAKTFEEVVQFCEPYGIDIITSGAVPENPSELLESDRLTSLLAMASARYDIVILDAPPALAVTDVSVLASRVDGVLLVLNTNKVSQRAATQSLRNLLSAKARLLGLVVRGVRPEDDPYYRAYHQEYIADWAARRKKQRQGSRPGLWKGAS